MNAWVATPFAQILADSKDGEWGEGEEAVGLREAIIIRGTDFFSIDDPTTEFPRRWIKNHIVERKRLRGGDILLETAGGTSAQSTGRSALVKEALVQRHREVPILCASFSRHLRLKTEEYSPRFIYYSLRALYGAGYMAVFNIQHTGVSRFQYTAFKRHTKLTIPLLQTQQRVGAVLAAYDDLIENNRRRIILLERLAEEIYREWFVRLRFPHHASTKVVKGIPAGWSLVCLRQAFEYTGGGTPSKQNARYWLDGDVDWYTPSDITAADGIFLWHSADKCTDEGLRSSSAKMFPPYSIMLTSRATIGAIGINVTAACTNQGFITCIPNARYPLPYLYHWLKLAKPHFQLLSGGATFAELTKGTFKKIEILTPPQSVMNDFVQIQAPIFKSIEALLATNQQLVKARDLLLPRLISGQLSVEDLEIQFPPGMAEELNGEASATADA